MGKDKSGGHLFPWKWRLRSLKSNGSVGKVFSCFAGGGGSSMGWKLAGFNVVGCNEIDRRMASCYVANLSPRMLFCEPIQDFRLRKSLPDELFGLDVLDGSPPCSLFSVIHKEDRHERWGKKRKFREGQAEQVLDTLFFEFIALAKRLRPKAVVAENVPGMLVTGAKAYFSKVLSELDKAGYSVAWKVLDAQRMGVPQRRKRLFFLGLRKDLTERLPKTAIPSSPLINMQFVETPIRFGAVRTAKKGRELSSGTKKLLESMRSVGTRLHVKDGKVSRTKDGFCWRMQPDSLVLDTIVADSGTKMVRSHDCTFLSDGDIVNACTFPQDYLFAAESPRYVCGMSVPPVMMAQVACRVQDQWLRRLLKDG